MPTPRYTRQFDRDVKRMQRRKKNLEKLKIVIRSLITEQPLDAIHRDHGLVGTWHGRRECHGGSWKRSHPERPGEFDRGRGLLAGGGP